MKNRYKELIGNNKFEELFKDLLKLKLERDLSNNIILQKSRFTDLKESYNKGLIEESTFFTHRSRISTALMNLVEEIDPTKAPETKNTFPNNKPNMNMKNRRIKYIDQFLEEMTIQSQEHKFTYIDEGKTSTYAEIFEAFHNELTAYRGKVQLNSLYDRDEKELKELINAYSSVFHDAKKTSRSKETNTLVSIVKLLDEPTKDNLEVAIGELAAIQFQDSKIQEYKNSLDQFGEIEAVRLKIAKEILNLINSELA